MSTGRRSVDNSVQSAATVPTSTMPATTTNVKGSHSRARPACPCFLRLSRLKETPIRFRFIVVIKIDTPTKNVHPLARLDGLKMTVTMALPRAVATSERRSLYESIAAA